MSKPKLNIDEKEILKDFEAGEFESVLTPRRKKYIQASAEETFKKDKRINIRVSLGIGHFTNRMWFHELVADSC